MLKYDYILIDKNNKPFSAVSDDKEIELFLQRINGVYRKLAIIEQKNREIKEIKTYLVHQNNGNITEYKTI